MTIDSKTLAGFIIVFTVLVNVVLQYFSITGTITCALASASPKTQAAAAGLVGR